MLIASGHHLKSTQTHFENEARGHSKVARKYESEIGSTFEKNRAHFADLDQPEQLLNYFPHVYTMVCPRIGERATHGN